MMGKTMPMDHIMTLTADRILATPPHKAAELLPDAKDLRRALVKLAARWHPDSCADPRASDVFAHILSMRDHARGGSKPTTAAGVGFRTAEGRGFRLSPLSRTPVDQGEVLLCQNSLMTRFEAGCIDLAEAELAAAARFRFADDKMRSQMAPFIPKIIKKLDLDDGGAIVAARRDPEEILLSDMLNRSGPMPPVHAAWLCSGLMNIAAWLGYCELVHGAIGPETILVDPAKHSVRLAAGWGFASPAGTRPAALPGRTLDLLPRLAIKGEAVDSRTDLELVRQTVREALGDPRGSAGPISALPAPISGWLSLPPAASAAEDYAAWQRALEAGWGKRRFVDYPVRAADVYAARAA